MNSVGKHHGVFLREHMGHRPTRPTLLPNGRSWSGIDVKATFQNLRHEAKPLHQKLLPQIQQQASTLDHGKVLAMLRGQA